MKAAVLSVVCLLGCAGSPSSSVERRLTSEEQTAAALTIASVESAVAVTRAAGRMNDEQFALVTGQIADLRKLVREAGERPVHAVELMQRITSLAIAWAPSEK